MTLRPGFRLRLYLDVDGVLNADAPLWGDTVVATVDTVRGGTPRRQKITYSPALMLAIARLGDEFDVEIVWLTTWIEDGCLTDFVIETGDVLSGGRWLSIPARGGAHGELPGDWKRAEILADLAGHPAPYIWADDDEVHIHGQFVAGAFNVPSLLIAPHVEFGLQRKHIDQMRFFAASPHTYSE